MILKYNKETEEEKQYKKDLDQHYRYDNSIRSISAVQISQHFVTDEVSANLWAAMITVMGHYWHAKNHLITSDFDQARFRLFMGNDPALMKSHNAQLVEVFYRTSETPAHEFAIPFSPWPDVYLGELYLLFKDGKPNRMAQVLHGVDANHPLARRERVTDYTKFPGCWTDGKEESRNHLWFPGTNVPVEEMTELLYAELKETVLKEMAF